MIEFIHKSHVSKVRACSQQHYYDNVIKAKPEFENEKALLGQSFHAFSKEIYVSNLKNKWDEPSYWCQWLLDDFKKRKEACISDDIDVNSPKDLKAEEYLEFVVQFLKQPYNRLAIPILLETTFRFYIKRGKKRYAFEGTIDQLLKIPTKTLHSFTIDHNSIRSVDTLVNKEYVYIHRDVKTGDRKIMSELNLLTNEDLMFYSYGLAYGLFNTKDDWATAQPINKHGPFIPFAHALYYVADHLKYIRGSRDGTKPAGSYKGQAMYFVKRDVKDLRLMEEQLILWHKKVNSELYTRDAAGTAFCEYCKHQQKCLHELKIGELHG